MRHLHRILAFVALPPAFLLYALALFSVRSLSWMYAMDNGYTPSTVSTAAYAGTALATAGGLVGALVAAAVGPHFAVTAGLALLSGAAFGLAFGPEGALFPALAVLYVGQGIVRVGGFAAAAMFFGRAYGAARDALCVLLYGAFNGGALLAPLLAFAIFESVGYRPVFVTAAVLALVPALVAAALGAAGFLIQTDDDPPPPLALDRRLGAAAVVAGLSILPLACLAVVTELSAGAMYQPGGPTWVLSVNPVLVTLTVPVLALVALGLQAIRMPLPTLSLVGLGLLASALTIGPALFPGVLPIAVVASGVAAVGECLVFPLLMSRAGGDLHWRLAAFPIAVMTGAHGLSSIVASWLSGASGELRLGILAAVGLLVSGIAFVVGGWFAQRRIFEGVEEK